MSKFNVISATSEHAEFVGKIYNQNVKALHGGDIYNWKELFARNDSDEENYIICLDNFPVAWLRVNGLLNDDIAWISMLIVDIEAQHQGVGTYTVRFAEEYIKSKGFRKIGIHTTEDNLIAQALYKKCGFVITEYSDCTNGDGMTRKGLTLQKELY